MVTISNHEPVVGQTVSKLEYIKNKISETVKTMGFKSINFPVLASGAYIVEVSWEAGDPDERPVKKRRCGNHEITCGLCHEVKVAKRVAPCGHMICEDCSAGRFVQCPFCRTAVAAFEDLYQP